METHWLRLSPPTKIWQRQAHWWLGVGIGLLLVSVAAFWYATQLAADQIWPHVVITTPTASLDVGHLTRSEAQELIQAQLAQEQAANITLKHNDQIWSITAQQLGFTSNWSEVLEQAWQIGRRGPWWQQRWERWQKCCQPTVLNLQASYDPILLQAFTASIAAQLNVPGRHPRGLVKGQSFIIDNGQYGQVVAESAIHASLQKNAGVEQNLDVPLIVTHTPLSPDGQQQAQKRLQKLRPAAFSLQLNAHTALVQVPPSVFFAWLQLPGGYHEASLSADLQQLTAHWNQEPQNAEFIMNEQQQLTTFKPHEAGRTVELAALSRQVVHQLSAWEAADQLPPPSERVISVPVTTVDPDITLEKTNNLGIKELLSTGTSSFQGSIPNRVYNVNLTSQRLHGTLVAPGQEFSFAQAVGEISNRTGYKSAYVIRNGRTELGDGGGVCQVSTTVFRAALQAGFPITQWKPHSYRVGYYEQDSQPGFDATVYAPSVDFKFRNDTGHHIVVATQIDVPRRHLNVQIWGTADGRQSAISAYKIWNQRPAPPTEYIPDPHLPVGTKQQIDWSAPGASTSFHYEVKDANGQIKFARDFVSHFRPWRAVFLVGTGAGAN